MKTSRLEISIIIAIILLTSTIVCFMIDYETDDVEHFKKIVYRKEYLDPNVKEIEKQKEVEVVELKEPIVYDNLTYDELVAKINRNLNSTLTDKGSLFVDYSLEFGIDPYLAVAIALHETGCSWNCSYLTNACHNVGGQKGSGCGEYAYFNSLEEGIYAFISNIYNNYYKYGLINAELMNHKYAESTSWSYNVNRYIEKIKLS